MTNKLTGREALAYMATGGWFTTVDRVAYALRPDGSVFLYNQGDNRGSIGFSHINSFVLSGITPCPDPTVKVDEYEVDKKAVMNAIQFAYLSDERRNMIEFFEKHFQRKEQK